MFTYLHLKKKKNSPRAGGRLHKPYGFCVSILTVDVRVQARSRGGGELDSHKEVSLSFAGPGEIKRMEVVLDPQDSPEEQGGGAGRWHRAGLRKLDFFCFSCYSTAVLRTLSM